MIGIFLALIVAFLKSLGELAGKVFTNEKKKSSLDEYSLAFGARFFSLIILAPIVFIVNIPHISLNMFGLIFISSLFASITTITALKAVKYGDLSLVSPLSALSLPFLLVTSYFITHESPNIYGYIGVAAIFIGTYFLQLHKIKNGFLGPIKALFYDTGSRYMFITAILWSITAPLDKIGVGEYGALSWMMLINFGACFFISIYMLFIRKSFPIKKLFQIRHIKKVSIITLLGGTGVFLQLIALKYTLVVYVISLKRASGMFSVLLGYFFFKEKNIVQKFFAAGIMLAGVLIITLLGNI